MALSALNGAVCDTSSVKDITLLIHCRTTKRSGPKVCELRRPLLQNYGAFFAEVRWLLSEDANLSAWPMGHHCAPRGDPYWCVAQVARNLTTRGLLYMHFDAVISPCRFAVAFDASKVGIFKGEVQCLWKSFDDLIRMKWGYLTPRMQNLWLAAVAELRNSSGSRLYGELEHGLWHCSASDCARIPAQRQPLLHPLRWGMDDFFYLPREAFHLYGLQAEVFWNHRVFHEMAGPTLLELTRRLAHLQLQDYNCTGFCCWNVTAEQLRREDFRCGHKVRYEWPRALEAVQTLLRPPARPAEGLVPSAAAVGLCGWTLPRTQPGLLLVFENQRQDVDQIPGYKASVCFNNLVRLAELPLLPKALETLKPFALGNTNHIGHPPHADNVQFDSVWWQGERVPKEDEVQAAREGAYVLWRNEKTSYRSYSCSVSLCDPAGYEGGLVQFFRGFGIKEPVANYKCQEGHGIAFCGCHRNIHAVTGVTSGFRLVFLIWTRPPHVRVPENQMHTCYFRPGTGHGVWLTTADIQRHLAKRNGRGELRWAPVGEDDTCRCAKCTAERKKARWQDCGAPETRIGNATEEKAKEHCPLPPPLALCATHGRWSLGPVISKADIRTLKQIWLRHHDDLNKPAYTEKPELSQAELAKFKHVAFKVLRAMARSLNEELELDQAMVSQTSHQGDPPHADNVQFDSVWWQGRRIRERDEVRAAQHGAAVHYALGTENRNYCAMVLLSEPWDYKGGDLEFFGGWGDKDSELSIRPAAGHAWGYCGCHRGIHAVRGVRSGERLALLVWTRPQGTVVAEEQA
ncbi:unnamed protein product, partial [Effrenium voratum]